jgi:magnesium-protoporphyrin O-methyltransferase
MASSAILRFVPDRMPCDCPGCPNVFTDRSARDDLARYRRNGPDPSTRRLIEAIVAEGIDGGRVLDIGGGIGVIQLELLAAGAASTETIDASGPYVVVARAEAERRGYADRTSHREGDFVVLADAIEPADVVTLDRMICCYSDMPGLIARAVDHARRMVGLVYPRDTLWTHALAMVMNAGSRLLRRKIRWYIHSEAAADGLLRAGGFERRVLQRGLLWQTALYVRSSPA